MAIPNEVFNEIPINTRVAGSYFEIDGSRADGFTANHVALLIGQSLATGTADNDELVIVPGTGDSSGDLFGKGSNLALMVKAFRENNDTMTLYALPMADLGVGVKASGTLTVTGTATESRALAIYVAAERVFVGVSVDDTNEDIAASIVAAVSAKPDLPVTAAAAAGVVTFTAKNAGEVGNDLRIQVALRGILNGEKVPDGVSIAVSDAGFLTGGSGNPDIAGALAVIGDDKFNYIGFPWTDSATLDAATEWLEEQQSAGSEVDVKAFTGRRGTLSELVTFGSARNDRFVTTIESFDAPGPVWMRAARYLGQASAKLFNHPARPLFGVELIGEMAPPKSSLFTFSDKNTLLFAGVTVTDVGPDGKVRLNMPITMYQTNEFGDESAAYLLVNTVAQLGRLRDELRSVVNSRIMAQRPVLVNDGTPIDDAVPHVTPRSVKATLIAHYEYLQSFGLVESIEEFEKRLSVSKSPNDAFRLNVVYEPDLSNPLYVFATKISFSLDFRNY